MSAERQEYDAKLPRSLEFRTAPLRIEIQVIPHALQRYPTVGDWYEWEGDFLRISVSDLNDWRYAVLIALHELIEAACCRVAGVSEASVREFDTTIGAELPDPGADPRAPYHGEHVFSENVERQVAQALGVNWQQYDAEVQSL